MLLYNITNKVDHHIHDEWIGWMQQSYIPYVMESGVFDDYKFSRLLGVDESDGFTYALQFTISSRPAFDIYQEKFAYDHQQLHDLRYKGNFVTFRSLLDVIDHGH
ncbi:hypothetical protein GGR28_000831 [Lewinella aquimaris]|uniref:DUF4286 domain-containing protein n=1 Tax=Neolewinella aquimaris TaxID=1835722 RepID=A0A840DZ96_9BACT|nr:DUF4286 family protein [Neolewinella aquimaris]MBB4078230.1 hypothetical protein [Neolewinella aquimaris]